MSRTIRSTTALRRRDSRGQLRRGQRDRLGSRARGSRRRAASKTRPIVREGQAQIRARRREAARRLDAGAQHCAATATRNHGCSSRNATRTRARSRLRRAAEAARQRADRFARRAQRSAARASSAGSARRRRRKPSKAAARKATKDDRPDIVAKRNAESLRTLSHEPSVEGAVEGQLPATLKPQLATLVDARAARADDWIYEIKFDGYRLLARIDGGNEVAADHPQRQRLDREAGRAGEGAAAAATLPDGWSTARSSCSTTDGRPDFQALQNAFDSGRPQHIVYFLFDAALLNGHDLRDVPLVERARAAARRWSSASRDPRALHRRLRRVTADDLLEGACRHGARRHHRQAPRLAPTSSRARSDWIKLKCGRRQEFVIGGYTDPKGSRTGIRLAAARRPRRRRQAALRAATSAPASTSVAARHQEGARQARDATRCPFAARAAERSARRTGSSRSWWRSVISANGRASGIVATRCSRACATTSRRGRSCKAEPMPHEKARGGQAQKPAKKAREDATASRRQRQDRAQTAGKAPRCRRRR